jgi:hypothetical protein
MPECIELAEMEDELHCISMGCVPGIQKLRLSFVIKYM